MEKESNKGTGRFYTSDILADFLASLVRPLSDAPFAIDPMVGSGSLIKALLRRGIDSTRVYGVDIDAEAVSSCKHHIREGRFLCQNAFDVSCSSFYLQHAWDIVIANPPFIRRERLSSMGMHSGDIRTTKTNLLKVLESIKASRPFVEAASSCSSFADLAVLSAILCAALVREGGTLALILPEACLKRSYGKPLRKLFSSEFDIQVLVEDASRTWFKDAQVKTCLLVAKKAHPSSSYSNIVVERSLATEDSLLGNVSFPGAKGYEALSLILETQNDFDAPGLSIKSVKQADLLAQTPASAVAGKTGLDFSFLANSLNDWGLQSGQGLRTGANSFFYLEGDEAGYSNEIIDQVAPGQRLSRDCEALVPALKEQAEAGNTVDPSSLKHRLLLIRHLIDEMQISNPTDRELLKLAISFAEKKPIKSQGKMKLIPAMSAVKTNGPTTEQVSDRYWYMLPPLHTRHKPDIAFPRVVGQTIRAMLLPDDHSVVCDANFITVWRTTDTVSRESVVALLSSTLIQLQLECLCAVMGGGALKIESANLKQLLLPKPTAKLAEILSQLGELLVTQDEPDGSILDLIDRAILESYIQDSRIVESTLSKAKIALQALRKTRTNK